MLSWPAPILVVHFAAESHVDRSITGAIDFMMTNVVGTQSLLDAALAEVGLADTVQWYRDNRGWWEPGKEQSAG